MSDKSPDIGELRDVIHRTTCFAHFALQSRESLCRCLVRTAAYSIPSEPPNNCFDDRITVAERSRLYNDLIAEVNGFRRHFFLRQKIDPKEAYRQARRRQDAVSSRGKLRKNISRDDLSDCVRLAPAEYTNTFVRESRAT